MWSEIIFSVPQGLVLWSLLFKIFYATCFTSLKTLIVKIMLILIMQITQRAKINDTYSFVDRKFV